MPIDQLQTIAWIALRVAIGVLFINAAWACGKDEAAIKWTEQETSILFPRYSRLFAIGGILIMGLGGASILLGMKPCFGGTALAIFVILGATIHLRQMNKADSIGLQIKEQLHQTNNLLVETLTTSAHLAHYSSALKNYALAGVLIFVAIIGTGPFSLWP